MRKSRWLVFGLLCWLLRSSPVNAQVWQRDPVLSEHRVLDLAFASNGFVWLGTDGGIFRYDGRHTVPLKMLIRRGPMAPTSSINNLELDSQGRLWAGGIAGLFCFDPATGESQRIALPGLPGETHEVWHVWQYPGTSLLWISYGNDALLRLDTRHVSRRRLVQDKPLRLGYRAEWFGATPDGGFWTVTQYHSVWQVDRLGRPKWRHQQPHAQVLPVAGSNPLRLFSARALYEVTSAGTLRELTRWLPPGVEYTFDPILTDSTAQWIADGQWLSLAWSSPNALPQVRRRPAPPRLIADIHLLPGTDNLLWAFRPFERGCYKVRATSDILSPLAVRGGQTISSRAIGRLPDGRLLVGSYSGTFTQATDSPAAPLRPWRIWRTNPTPEASGPFSQAPVVYDLLISRSGRVVVADEVGLVGDLDPATGALSYYRLLTPPPNRGPNAFCLLEDHTGQGWAGTEVGLYQFDAARQTLALYRVEDRYYPLHGLKIEKMVEAPAGILWLATAEGLFRLEMNSGQLAHYGPNEPAPRRFPSSLIQTLYATTPDSIWVGTRDVGLVLLHPAKGVVRQLSLHEGLPSASVATILPDRLSQTLWLGTFNGLVRYTPHTGAIAVLTEADGLPAAELNRQSAWRDPASGLLYFGSVGGICRLNPRQTLAPQAAPRLLLTALTQHFADADTVRTTWLNGTAPTAIHLGPYDAFVELELALTELLAPEGARYSYRLLNDNQQPAFSSLSNNARLRLQNLRPGNYTLEIRAETSLGQPAHNTLQIPLTVSAVWWQQPWVWALLPLMALAAVYLRQRRRIAELMREQALRSRIAADLHDEMGSLLTRVNIHAEVLLETGATPDQLTELLQDSRAAVATMRDVVWSIDAHSDTVAALLDRMRDHLERTLEPAGWHFNLKVENLTDSEELPSQLRQHLYLIFKEAATNALRHARGATRLDVSLARQGRRLVLEVTDDGEPAPQRPSRSGMGLRSMQQRAAAMGGALEAAPAPGRGFRVRCVA